MTLYIFRTEMYILLILLSVNCINFHFWLAAICMNGIVQRIQLIHVRYNEKHKQRLGCI